MTINNSISVDITDSFVYNKIKYANTNGNGEAKLYVGQISEKDELDQFFNVTTTIFEKDNLIEYLNRAFIIYKYHIFGDYRAADYSYWNEMYMKVRVLNDKIVINESIESFQSGNRYYIRLQHGVFKNIFRRIALPVITFLKITKCRDEELESDVLKFELFLKDDIIQELKTNFKKLATDSYEGTNGLLLESQQQYAITKPFNRILFGAPGTGKSFQLEEERKNFGENYERVTFHPNYTYSQFVGSYKPKLKVKNDGTEYISYQFVPGPFLRILIKALNSKKICDNKNYLLIIEEINRANVAAVFGDIFQLLDRDDNGVSEYAITTSEEMREYLIKECGFNEEEISTIKIPNNLYIWATMNSADQGVSPIDAAFKRRWNFEYININNGSSKITGKKINLKPYGEIEWDGLRGKINNRLIENDLNINEDKLIGPFFITDKDMDSYKTDEIFKSKLLMYLFEDVLRHRRGKFFKPELKTFSAIIDAYDAGKNVFDFEVDDTFRGTINNELEDNITADNSEVYMAGNE
ncbi:AAA family ATPase [Clostridiaceae bacterium M8S5]|nr:AAA family ATPase [Clostridiaceae bacterium M8S5]